MEEDEELMVEEEAEVWKRWWTEEEEEGEGEVGDSGGLSSRGVVDDGWERGAGRGAGWGREGGEGTGMREGALVDRAAEGGGGEAEEGGGSRWEEREGVSAAVAVVAV